MGQFARIVLAAVALMMTAALGLIYELAFVQHVEPMVRSSSGPMTAPILLIGKIMVPLIGLILLAIMVFVLIGPIQEEKATQGRRGPPRRPPL